MVTSCHLVVLICWHLDMVLCCHVGILVWSQAEPCIRSEQSTIEDYLTLTTVVADKTSELLDFAVR